MAAPHTAEVLECHTHATTGPWNYALTLGILPFNVDQYELFYAHASWTLLETVAVLDFVVTHGMGMWKLIPSDPVLSVRHTIQECEARFLHMLSLSAAFCHAVGGPGIPTPIDDDTPVAFMPPLAAAPSSSASSVLATQHHQQQQQLQQQQQQQEAAGAAAAAQPAATRGQRIRTPSVRHPQLMQQQQFQHFQTQQPPTSSAVISSPSLPIVGITQQQAATAAAIAARAMAQSAASASMMDDDESDVVTGSASMANHFSAMSARGGGFANRNTGNTGGGGRRRTSGIGKKSSGRRGGGDSSEDHVSDGDDSDDGAPSAHHRASAMAAAGTRSSARLSTATRRTYIQKDEDDSFSDASGDERVAAAVAATGGDRSVAGQALAAGSAMPAAHAVAAAAMAMTMPRTTIPAKMAGGAPYINNLPPSSSPPIEYTGDYDEDDNPIPVVPVGKKIERILALRDRRLTAAQLAAEQKDPPDARHIQKRRVAAPSPTRESPFAHHDNQLLEEQMQLHNTMMAAANGHGGIHGHGHSGHPGHLSLNDTTLKLEPIKLEMDIMDSPPLTAPMSPKDDTPVVLMDEKDDGLAASMAAAAAAAAGGVASSSSSSSATGGTPPIAVTEKKIGDIIIREYLIKIEGESYLHCEWHSIESMRNRWGLRVANDKVKRFMLKWEEIEAKNIDQFGGEPFDPRFIEVERIIASRLAEVPVNDLTSYVREALKIEAATTGATTSPVKSETMKTEEDGDTKDSIIGDAAAAATSDSSSSSANMNNIENGMIKVEYFTVKWMGLSYSQCTEELAVDINDEMKIAQFRRFNRPPGAPGPPNYSQEEYAARIDNWYSESAVYKNKNQLRDYQIQGVNWLIKGWHQNRNLILADEMGLGKTVQCVAFLEHLRKVEHIRGPFLIVVPLSTLTHWKREVELWTDMNGILYHDPVKGKETRRYMRDHEFWFPTEPGTAPRRQIKFNILITSYEVFLADLAELVDIKWRYVIIDEGHRIKNKSAKLLEGLKQLRCNRRLLMSGTPIQNNTSELWTLMNFLQPEEFSSQREFADRFGSLERTQQVTELKALIDPYMLRRMKEQAEKSIPDKNETVVDIELTTLQKQYYRAIYDKNLKFLRIGPNTQNAPRLVNIEMELRKCCNHPWLINGAEEKEVPDGCTENEYYEKTIQASGKLVLLHKLLPKLKRAGHKVLIFSQMKKVLDILQGYMKHFGFLHERLDGGVTGNEREAAIDRFNRKDLNRFVFLLSTRAGGVGLNLATADVVIIFDSDWNPQQDVQAQARAHRIGQKNNVQVYRLVTAKTYEAEMFHRASKKLGLDRAVLKPVEHGGGDAPDNDHDVDEMLRVGAYGLLADDETESNKFCEADIDTILASRTRTLRIVKKDGKAEVAIESKHSLATSAADLLGGGATVTKGPGYNKMRFQSDQADSKIDVTDPEFWTKFGGAGESRTSPDFLLAQLTDGSATKNETTKATFFRAMEDTNKRIQTQRRAGEEPSDLDDFINLLIQFSAMSAQFNDTLRDRADVWLAEVEKRGERKVRSITSAATVQSQKAAAAGGTGGGAGGSNAPTRGGRQQSMKASTGATLSDLSATSSSSEAEEEPDSDAPKPVRGRGRPPGSKNRQYKLKKKGEDSEFEVSSDDEDIRGKAKGKTGAKMNVTICDRCDIAGALLQCEGDCARSFHLKCLGMDAPPPATQSWVCDECRTGNYACFACGKISSADKDPTEFRRCNVAQCGKFYHVACARKSAMYHFQSGSSNFRCAHHYCVTCKHPGDSKSMVHCQKCPSAFHLRCLQSKGITRLTRKLIYCHDCKVKQSATPEGRQAIDKSAQYLTQPLVRKPLPKVKLRKRRGRKLGTASKKPPAPPNAGMYTIRWLVDEEVVWQSYRVPIYCSLDGGGGPPVIDTQLANVLQLQPEPGTDALQIADGRLNIGKYRLKLSSGGGAAAVRAGAADLAGTTAAAASLTAAGGIGMMIGGATTAETMLMQHHHHHVPLLGDDPQMAAANIAARAAAHAMGTTMPLDIGGSDSDTEWCSSCSDDSDSDEIKTTAVAATATSDPTATTVATGGDDDASRRGAKRGRDDDTATVASATMDTTSDDTANNKRARTTTNNEAASSSSSSSSSAVASAVTTGGGVRPRRRHKREKKGRRARTTPHDTAGSVERQIKAQHLWLQLERTNDDQIFQMLEQCGLARACVTPPLFIMGTEGQPVQIVPPQSVDWCRVCGARAAQTFNTGPWGARKLCRPHWIQWHRQPQSLDLRGYVNEPVAPIFPYLNTEKRYLLHYLKRANVTSSLALSSSASAPYAPIPVADTTTTSVMPGITTHVAASPATMTYEAALAQQQQAAATAAAAIAAVSSSLPPSTSTTTASPRSSPSLTTLTSAASIAAAAIASAAAASAAALSSSSPSSSA